MVLFVSEIVVIENLTCPKCGSNIYNKEYAEKGIYICQGQDDTNVLGKCCTVQYLCKTCNKIYPEDHFGKHGDVYECKECGSVNWPCTDRKRETENTLNIIKGKSNAIDNILRGLKL